MPESDIRIEHIQVENLIPFAERVVGASSEGQFVPISMQRAVAHAHNPYAAKTDVAPDRLRQFKRLAPTITFIINIPKIITEPT